MEITKQLAHVMFEENLFIREVEQSADGKQYFSTIIVDGQHPYLYENAAIANHVSGTTFLDVCRQLLKAISHLSQGNPIDNRFVIRNVSMDFARWTKIGVPVQIVAEVTPQWTKIRGQDCINYVASVNYYQEGRLTCAMTGQYSTFPGAIEELLMGRQYRQAPLPPAAAKLAAATLADAACQEAV
mgnify:CR=1 FL=1